MKTIRKILGRIVLFFFVSTILSVFIYRWCPVYVTPLMLIRCCQQMAKGEMPRLQHKWVSLDEMSAYMPVAVMASEDQRFLDHHGFDMVEIQKAIDESKRGKRNRGASTISQQTAKNVFLWPGHSYVRKGLEVYFTGLIELIWGKHRIMEVYLNSIEMGDGIYGVEAVAQAHFGRSGLNLSRPNCALIAGTLPNPRKFSSAHPSPYMLRRQTAIMRQMRNISLFPKD